MSRAYPTNELAEAVQAVEADGNSRSSILCPRCAGGRTGERSVSVYRSAACVKARCHRASCSWWDKWISFTGPRLPEDEAHAPRPYGNALAKCDVDMRRVLMQRYGLYLETIDAHIRHAVEDQDNRTIYMPVRGPYGDDRGGMLKRLTTQGKHKTSSYVTNRNAPFIAWYPQDHQRSTIVIVEDQLSAMRTQQVGLTGVALLGTSMTDDRWTEIRDYAHRTKAPAIYLALDRDAFTQALRISRRFCPTTPVPVKVLLLEQDFKDSTDAYIEDAVSYVA